MDYPLPEVRRLLATHASGYDIVEISTFEMTRTRTDGKNGRVTVELRDGGAGHRERWTVFATDTEGRTATGQPGASLHDALAAVEWNKLDA